MPTKARKTDLSNANACSGVLWYDPFDPVIGQAFGFKVERIKIFCQMLKISRW
jgi:hypothetical protein